MTSPSQSSARSKAAAAAAASAGVETVFRTLFGSCTGQSRQPTGFTPLNDRGSPQLRAPKAGSEPMGAVANESFNVIDAAEKGKRVQFTIRAYDKAKEVVQRDGVIILTVNRNGSDDDAISAITSATLDELAGRCSSDEKDDAISAITATTLEEMARNYAQENVSEEFVNRNPNKLKQRYTHHKWRTFEEWNDDGEELFEDMAIESLISRTNKPTKKQIPKNNQILPATKNGTHFIHHKMSIHKSPVTVTPPETPPGEGEIDFLDGSKLVNHPHMTSYESVLSRLTALKRMVDDRRTSRKHDSIPSRMDTEYHFDDDLILSDSYVQNKTSVHGLELHKHVRSNKKALAQGEFGEI